MSTIAAVRGALPPYRYTQEEITEVIGAVVLGPGDLRRPLLERLHRSAGVRTRHLAMPLEDYRDLRSFTQSNTAFIDLGLELAQRAAIDALAAAQLDPTEVDCVIAVSVTGVAVPSLEARLVPLVGMRPDVKRVPLFGLGCVAGAAGVARAHDYLLGHPDEVVLLLSTELCSLTLQRDDDSMANLVASALFGDGAAAVVLVGSERARRSGHPGPRVVRTASRLYPGTGDAMGWDVGSGGFRVVLSPAVPQIVRDHLREDTEKFLADDGLAVADIGRLVAHPGGPKVLTAMAETLDRPDSDFGLTWDHLARRGNLSSASVLHVLERTIDQRPEPGESGLLLAMGPGFCAELVLLQW